MPLGINQKFAERKKQRIKTISRLMIKKEKSVRQLYDHPSHSVAENDPLLH
jgi:hypothetical protein